MKLSFDRLVSLIFSIAVLATLVSAGVNTQEQDFTRAENSLLWLIAIILMKIALAAQTWRI